MWAAEKRRPWLVGNAIGLFAVAGSTALPWYGLDQPANESWPFSLSPHVSALSDALTPWAPMSFKPGQQGFGYLILFLAAATGILALAVLLVGRQLSGGTRVRSLTRVLVLATTATCLATVTEALFRPTFAGDVGPVLTLDWGGVIGVAASIVATAAALGALWLAEPTEPARHPEFDASSGEPTSASV